MEKDKKKVAILRAKDKAFQIYCKGVTSIPDFQDNYAKRIAIEEKWALFLKRMDK